MTPSDTPPPDPRDRPPMWLGLAGAVQFLTRVPIHLPRAVPHARVLPWFPLVGAAIGGVVAAVAVGLREWLPGSVAAACAVVVGLLVTGAFHEDGLADVADAFGGGWTIERRLEILKDSRHGTYGVAALCSSVVVRIITVGSFATNPALIAGVVASHVLGRSAALVAVMAVPPATESGLGADVADQIDRRATLAGLLLGASVLIALGGWWAGPLGAAALVGLWCVAVLAVSKIGGIAGDVLGAIEQVVECLVLVTASGLAMRTSVWWA